MDPVMIGVLLDVSGSMKQSTGEGTGTRDGEWARSIITTIDNLIKIDLKPNNHIFAIGFGARRDPTVFDLLSSLNVERIFPAYSLWDVVDRILTILETNGASNVRKWAPKDILMEALTGQEYKCDRILEKLKRDTDFVQYVVNDCLPSACRDCDEEKVESFTKVAAPIGSCAAAFVSAPIAAPLAALACLSYLAPSSVTKPLTGEANKMKSLGSSAVTKVVTATKGDIDDVVDKIEIEMSNDYVPPPLKGVSSRSVYKVRAAHKLLHGHVGDENELTKQRIDELMDKVRPYIYGGTPLYEALGEAATLFAQSEYRDHKKLLFVLSDGIPTDTYRHVVLNNVTTVGCFITSSGRLDPYVLYSSANNTQYWAKDARFMFKLSSTMLTQNIPRTIFVKRKWAIEMINDDKMTNETQLFLQVNHPDHLKDACEFAREVVTTQEALSEVLASVDLDIYINQSNDAAEAEDQQNEYTCYAYASAAVMHLAMKRILGREGGYPDFHILRQEMIDCFTIEGRRGANTEEVLQKMCPRYRLQCKKVDKRQAMVAIMEKRPVVARFRLTKREWGDFRRFFWNDGKGILTSDDVNIHRRRSHEETIGHAVVLISFNSKYLRFMNSRGTEWGDGGFFNVQDADVLGFEFFDVYWNEEDLTPDEKAYHAAHGSEVADKLMRNLIGLQESTFKCPLCKISSKVTEFTGHLSNVTCPICEDTFECGTKGNILALNLYLTSLS